MLALVTGGAGFIGSNLVKSLIEDKKWEVIVVDNLSIGYEENIHPKCCWLNITLGQNNNELKEKVGEVDIVFHLAAVPRVSYSVKRPYETCQNNIMSTLAVLEFARTTSRPNSSNTTGSASHPTVVFSSSSSIYGGADILPTPEWCPAKPQSPYALEKWQGEEWCRLYANLYDLNVICLRYFNVIGPGSRYGGAYSTVFSAWLYSILIDSSISPYIEGDGFQSRDFTSVENIVQANILAATTTGPLRGTPFNIAQGETRSLINCKELLEEIYGRKFDFEHRPPRVGDVRNTWADIESAKIRLRYNPDCDFKSQLKKMADWFLEHYKTPFEHKAHTTK